MKTYLRVIATLCLMALSGLTIPEVGIGKTWTQIGSNIYGDVTGAKSEYSVSLNADGTIVAIGVYKNASSLPEAGPVRVYKNVSGTWTQIGSDIHGEANGDQSGTSVSLSANGTILAIGAPWNSPSGHVRVYKYIAGSWTQIGSDIDGEAEADMSGFSVNLSADGTILAIGAPGNSSTGDNAGHARVYENVADTWTQIGSDIDGESAGDLFGGAVSLSADGTILAIGARWNSSHRVKAGHVRVYENVADTWAQIGSDIDGEATSDELGSSVSLSADGTIFATGATGNKTGYVSLFRIYTFPWVIFSPIIMKAALAN